MTDAKVEVSEDGDVVRIAVAGEVDLANAGEVEAAITGAVTNQAAGVSIDLAAVDYLDSAGLRVLFSLADRLVTLQIDLELVAPVGSPARRVVELSGLDGVATLRPTRPPPGP